jgi:hypothetical protein
MMHLHPIAAERAAKLCAGIKTETRWLLISARADMPAPQQDEFSAAERAAFLKTWPDIRHRRVPATYLGSFYDLVSDQASTLAHLIEIRRQRERNRKAMP